MDFTSPIAPTAAVATRYYNYYNYFYQYFAQWEEEHANVPLDPSVIFSEVDKMLFVKQTTRQGHITSTPRCKHPRHPRPLQSLTTPMAPTPSASFEFIQSLLQVSTEATVSTGIPDCEMTPQAEPHNFDIQGLLNDIFTPADPSTKVSSGKLPDKLATQHESLFSQQQHHRHESTELSPMSPSSAALKDLSFLNPTSSLAPDTGVNLIPSLHPPAATSNIAQSVTNVIATTAMTVAAPMPTSTSSSTPLQGNLKSTPTRAPSSTKQPTSSKKHNAPTTEYSCMVCQRKFKHLHNLKMHMSSHKEAKTYECSECGKEFVRLYDLKRHMRCLHTGERPYQCEECDAEFSRADGLKKHIEVVHGVHS